MAPVRDKSAILFHPKKKKLTAAASPARPASPQKPAASAPSTPAAASPKPNDEDPTPLETLPDGPYTEYKLTSSKLNGWKYDVMKFDSRKPVDIFQWERPVKLNRKDLRRAPADAHQDEDMQSRAVGPMLGPDGKPVIGADGRIVMVDAAGKPIHAGQSSTAKEKPKENGQQQRKKKFQKKTKQVFKVPETVRQLRREERYPWVMEDSSGREVWTGSMEEASKAETHAFFMPAQNNTFKFVPAHRWYKFQKRPAHLIPTLEEAEALMASRNRAKDPALWLKQRRNGQGPSAATAAILRGEPEGGLDPHYVPNGRALRTVRRGGDLFGDDDDEGGSSRPKQEDGADADFDEVPYHEEFADDEEKAAPEDEEDEIEKEMEERLQKEYMSANKQRDGHVDEDEEEEDSKESNTAKAMRKLLGRQDKNTAYESDDEKNPYASSEEDEEEDEEVVSNEPAVQSHLTAKPSRAGSQTPTAAKSSPAPRPAPSSNSNSRATSPTGEHGGHSVVAKRATSPKVPKPKPVNGAVRATSPLASPPNGVSSKAGSPASLTSPQPAQPSAAASPTSPNRANSPTTNSSPSKPNNKRKADDEGDSAVAGQPSSSASAGGDQPKPKKRKAPTQAVDANGNALELTDNMVLDWLRKTPNVKTKDCIGHFTPYLHTDEQKSRFTALIKSVASLKSGVLVLKAQYRNPGTSAAPSPSAPKTPMDTT